jgi:type IV pilus assembly protein PilV
VKANPKLQDGVVLLEALIAILIFSIGILAIVGLQGAAVKTAADARYRSDAAFLAGELASQIWADAPNVANYEYPGTGAAPAPLRDYPTSKGWITRVAERLPGTQDVTGVPPIIDFSTDPTLGNMVDITVRWRMPEEAAKGLPAHQHRVRININLNP